MRWFPNLLSLSRVFLAPLIGWMILEQHAWAWTVFFWISWTDALDGWLARKMGVESKLGALLDPIGDKVWVIVATLAWWKMGRIPDWLMVMILFRDALIVVGTWVVNRKTGREDFSPSVYGKTSTVIQLTMLAGCFTLDEFWLQWLRLLAAMGTVVSGADYVRRGVAMMQTGQEKS